MEQYYEQNVINKDMDYGSKRTKTLSVSRTVSFSLAVFILLFGTAMLNIYWVFLLAALPFFVIGILLGRINKRANTEYDYVIDNDNISISAIFFRNRRKLKYKISLRSVESVGAYNSDGYRRFEKTVRKKYLALVNFDDENTVLYIVYKTDKGRFMIFIEPDRTFMLTMRRVMSAVSLFDSSVPELERRLSAKEAEIIKSAAKRPKEKALSYDYADEGDSKSAAQNISTANVADEQTPDSAEENSEQTVEDGDDGDSGTDLEDSDEGTDAEDGEDNGEASDRS